jgi:site-specific DNA recombinase
MSTAKQEASIPEQRDWAHRTTKAQNVELLAEFQDDAICGDEIGRRPGLADLLDYSTRHECDAVVVWDADRLSRADSFKTAVVLETLRASGVTRLLTQAEGWIDLEDDVDRLLFNIKQDMSRAAYVKSLSRNVTRSAIDRAKQGLWVAGGAPYGYRIGDDGHLDLGDPREIEVVKWIFHTFVTTADSYGDLCRKLRQMGAPAPRRRNRRDGRCGGTWQRTTIGRILACRLYLGEMVWNFSTQSKYNRIADGEVTTIKGGRRQAYRNNPTDWIVRPNAHPPIIDQETWETARKKRERTSTLARAEKRFCRHTPTPGGGEWALGGLLFCGDCGGRMVGITERRQHANYRYYVCYANSRIHTGACRRNGVKQEEVIQRVAELIQVTFADPRRLEALRAEVERKASRQEKDIEADRKRLQDALAAVDKDIDQGNRNLAMLPQDLLDGVIANVRARKEERDSLARELARLDAVAEVEVDHSRHVSAALEQLGELSTRIKAAPTAAVRDALAGLVDKITLHFKHGPIWKNGGCRTFIDDVEVSLREEAVYLLGCSKLLRSARSKA